MPILFQYVLTHPLKSTAAFWKAWRGKKALSERKAEEEDHLKALCQAIGLYKFLLGSWPSTLEDLCFNNHNDPIGIRPLLNGGGKGLLTTCFCFPYQYSVSADGYKVRSLGLEAAQESLMKK